MRKGRPEGSQIPETAVCRECGRTFDPYLWRDTPESEGHPRFRAVLTTCSNECARQVEKRRQRDWHRSRRASA